MTKLCDFDRNNPTVLAWLIMTLMKMFLLKFLLVGRLGPVDGAAQLRTGRRSVEQTVRHTGPKSTWFQQGLAPRRHEPVRAGSRRARDGISPVERSPSPELPHFSGRAVSERNEYRTSRGGTHGETGPSDREVRSISIALHSIMQAQNLHATKRGVISVQINIT